jgi:hypothetical protein
MSQRRTRPRPLRAENIEAKAIAAAIRTSDELLEMLDSLETDAERAEAARLLKPYLPQFSNVLES